MFVTRLDADDLDEQLARDEEGSVTNPSWELIEEAIRLLDGDQRSVVILGTDEDGVPVEAPHMGIGGGGGVYHPYVTFDNRVFFVPLDPAKGEERIRLVVAGQVSNKLARECVDLETVLNCAKTFAQSGQLDRSVQWEQH